MKEYNYTSVRYAAIRRDKADKSLVVEGTVIIPETDPRKVRKELAKRVGDVTIISIKKISLPRNRKFFTMEDLAIIDDTLTTVVIISDM